MEGLRFVQVTPPGSACSFCFGTGLQMFPEGQTQHLQAVVADAEAARAELTGRGIDCTDVEDLAWGRFVRFTDPDATGGPSSSSPTAPRDLGPATSVRRPASRASRCRCRCRSSRVRDAQAA